MVSVNASVPAKSVPELIAYAKANRGKLSIAFDVTAGAAGVRHPPVQQARRSRPHRGAVSLRRPDGAGRRERRQPGADELDRGRQRRGAGRQGAPLAVTSATRFPGLPDLPALNETLPGVVVDGWFGVVAPAGTPAEIVARVNREIGEFLKGPEIQQRLISFGLATEGAGTPRSTAQFIREMQAHWQRARARARYSAAVTAHAHTWIIAAPRPMPRLLGRHFSPMPSALPARLYGYARRDSY